MFFLSLLSILVGLATFVMFIIILIKLFQNEGALKGILGLICALYTFVWGWMKNKELGIRNLMIIWTILIVVGMILSTLLQSSM